LPQIKADKGKEQMDTDECNDIWSDVACYASSPWFARGKP